MSALNLNAQQLTGAATFAGAGDVNVVTGKVLRADAIGTTGFSPNRQFHLASLNNFANSGVNGILLGDRRDNPRGGFFIGENGAIGIRNNGTSHLLNLLVNNAGARQGNFRIGGLMIRWGFGSILGSGELRVNFPAGSFNAAPAVMVTPRTNFPNTISFSVRSDNPTDASGFTIIATRTNTSSTGFDWLAIGPAG